MTARTATEVTVRRDWLSEAGMGAVGLAAAASSYAALQDLALRTGWWPWLSWLLPLTVDAYAMTAVRIWLGRATRNTTARTWAKANAIGGIALSVAGNAVDHAAAAGVIAVSWPLIVAVSAIPPVVLGLLVHMAHLRGLPPADTGSGTPAHGESAEPRQPAADDRPATAQQASAADTTAPLPTVPPPPPAVVRTSKPRQPRRRTPADTGQRKALPPGSTDEELIAAARQRIAEEGEASATWLIKTFGIGTGRAGRIRDAAAQLPAPAAPLALLPGTPPAVDLTKHRTTESTTESTTDSAEESAA
ncbi:DUF2637 domain-containing protein [Streptomyces gamaensis]|uniref:DUF2637 domain-containing protein n=1 Tax=Streptomyces gamaensis TaxID=1763542 RepID=A0ABW0YZP1_9ACTN